MDSFGQDIGSFDVDFKHARCLLSNLMLLHGQEQLDQADQTTKKLTMNRYDNILGRISEARKRGIQFQANVPCSLAVIGPMFPCLACLRPMFPVLG